MPRNVSILLLLVGLVAVRSELDSFAEFYAKYPELKAFESDLTIYDGQLFSLFYKQVQNYHKRRDRGMFVRFLKFDLDDQKKAETVATAIITALALPKQEDEKEESEPVNEESQNSNPMTPLDVVEQAISSKDEMALEVGKQRLEVEKQRVIAEQEAFRKKYEARQQQKKVDKLVDKCFEDVVTGVLNNVNEESLDEALNQGCYELVRSRQIARQMLKDAVTEVANDAAKTGANELFDEVREDLVKARKREDEQIKHSRMKEDEQLKKNRMKFFGSN